MDAAAKENEQLPRSRRRKVRKGTQSCWECKRRKIRCIFDAAQNTTCRGCERRSTACISQDLPDPEVGAGSKACVGERLSRIEALLERLLDGQCQRDFMQNKDADLQALEHSLASGTEIATANNSSLQSIHASANIDVTLRSQLSNQDVDVRNALLAAWPCQNDLDVIVQALGQGSFALNYLSCRDSDGLSSSFLSKAVDRPAAGWHPILMIHNLLRLGFGLQELPRGERQTLRDHGVDDSAIMVRAVETAHAVLVSSPKLSNSVEGVECLLIAAMFYNNVANLRRSWLIIRQAIAHAQILELPQKGHTPLSDCTASYALNRTNDIWFRLMYIDGYLSMMLGLPLGSTDSTFANQKTLDLCTPQEQLQRMLCLAASQILTQQDRIVTNLEVIDETDSLFQKAAGLMPPDWWLLPDFSNTTSKIEIAWDTLRVFDHLTHFHLLTRLHLPYVLPYLNDTIYGYSRNTVIYASREVLVRFLALSKCGSTVQCCRVLDYLVYFASTILCLAHVLRPTSSLLNDFLPHQRLTDRGLLDCVLIAADSMFDDGIGGLYSQVANTLRYVLALETNVATGWMYRGTFYPQKGNGLVCGSYTSDTGGALYVVFPSFGSIEIVQDDIWTVSGQDPTAASSEIDQAVDLNLAAEAEQLTSQVWPW